MLYSSSYIRVMIHFKYEFLFILCILLAVPPSLCVKVNMKGSLSLGKDVMETISHYIKKNQDSLRRSMDGSKEPDRNTLMVKAASLCRGIDLCEGKYAFVNEYIVLLANAVESIFDGILNPMDTKRMHLPKSGVFEDHLRLILNDMKKLLHQANSQISEGKEAYVWMDVVKKVSAIFMAATQDFVNQRLEGDPLETKDTKKKLMQKVILAIVIVESRYASILCSEFNLCPKVQECTRSLNTFLEHFKEMPDDKVRMFIRYFFESLPENIFYFLNEDTANEFQVVLSDMIYSEAVPAKDILSSVQKAVEIRLRTKPIADFKKSYDIMMTHIILSDLDHFYPSRHRVFNFDGFLTHFEAWVKVGGRFHTEISQVMKDIKKKLSEESKEMIDKLMYETKTFLELALDP